jgi:large subunit ribosomal protein L10
VQASKENGMARPDKVAAVTEVRDRMQGASATMLTEYRGLTVSQLASLRAELRKSGAEYKIVKNTLTKIAVRDAGFEVPEELLTGPTAVTFCGEDPVAAAKALKAFAKDHPALVVKGGILEGRFIDAGEAVRLADLASREELLSKMAGLMQAIVAQPARLALANLSKAARLFGALQAKRAEAGETMDSGQAAPAAAGTESSEMDAPAADAPAADDQAPAPEASEDTAAAAGEAPTVDETPEPDSAEARAVTEAAADAGVNATPGETGPEGPAANTAPEATPEPVEGGQAEVDAAAQGDGPQPASE